jgi:hypothetical protein
MQGIIGWLAAVATLAVGFFVGMWLTKRFGGAQA